MRKFAAFPILAIVLFASAQFAQQPSGRNSDSNPPTAAKQAIEIPFVNKTLANGLEVIVLPDASVPIVTVEMAVRNGSFTEPLEFNGLSHLYEHMFFKPHQGQLLYNCELALQTGGTAYFREANCVETIKLRERIGSVIYLNNQDQLNIKNATTREEVVNYYFVTTSDNLGSAMRFINDAIRYPTFIEEELNEEIQVVIGEIDRNESNPFYYLDKTLKEKLFYKYPTRKKPLGTRQTVRSATVEKMKLIQSRYYVPNNAALVVTGDVDAERVFEWSEEVFGTWEKREKDPFEEFPLVEHPPLKESAGYFVEQPVQNVLIQIGWHGPSIGEDDIGTYAADVFSYILSQPNSRFQRKMVDSGLTVGTDIGYYTQRNVGPIAITLVTTPDKAKAALDAVYAEIADFDKPDYFTDEELENAKNLLEARDLFEREKLTEYAHTLAFWWSSTGIDYFRGYHKNLRAVTRKETTDYVKRYIIGKPHVGVALLSPTARTASKLTESDLVGK
ncbi:MAG: insulinase family protein [Acidobacteria bacterium]|nr:MAG: insulinase family protein [Acidobacteriota bacterium]REJ98348.1 MAG: insulinase family protein [Acidobacteriota bacterium]REK17092.1 MAG: insulinase family protein [Acidobacteriota bacterium]REK43002.1 MAG: insulinase family protein [Acidobacteriota bacterium]